MKENFNKSVAGGTAALLMVVGLSLGFLAMTKTAHAVICPRVAGGPDIICGAAPTPTPSKAPTPTPAPAPTPRTPTSTDYAQIQAVTGYPASGMSFIVMDGNYCYFGWRSTYVGGFYLLTNTSGSWKVMLAGKGALNISGFADEAPQINASIVQALVSGAIAQSQSRSRSR